MRASRYSRPTRRNPDDLLDIVLAGGGLLGGIWFYERWRNRQPTPGEDTNYPSGQALGSTTSGASGVAAITSHPSGHGQVYA